MPDILFIKTSSLGDVIHHMPAVTEAGRRLPGARFAWVVEEAFAPLVRLHPAVERVIAVASRRWRSRLQLASTWREFGDFWTNLRARGYDEIVDSQGLFRTALIARAARGRRHGYDTWSIREKPASVFYDVRHRVARDLHAIDRNRMLTGLALGYAPQGEADYGLDRRRLAAPAADRYAILLHATARPGKEWPEQRWIGLGEALARHGVALVLPWGTAAERARSERIAAALPGARVPGREPLDAVARLIAGASFVVGVDTGLLHLAAALGVPLAAIFTGSAPTLTGPVGSGPLAIVGADGMAPSVEDVVGAVERIVA